MLGQVDSGVVLAAATHHCAYCFGSGVVKTPMRKEKERICKCVYRKVCDSVIRTYKMVENFQRSHTSATMTHMYQCREAGTPEYTEIQSRTLMFLKLEYTVDAIKAARRTLNPTQLKIFMDHLLGEQPWFEFVPKVISKRGNFFHEVYRVKEAMGKVYLDPTLRLYPARRYFNC